MQYKPVPIFEFELSYLLHLGRSIMKINLSKALKHKDKKFFPQQANVYYEYATGYIST